MRRVVFDAGEKTAEYVDLTAEELAAIEQMKPIPMEPPLQMRIAALEEELAAAKILLGVEE